MKKDDQTQGRKVNFGIEKLSEKDEEEYGPEVTT